MDLIIFLIPIITVIIIVSTPKFRKECQYWEYALIVLPSILLFFILKSSMVYINSIDTEYLGDIVNKITYYEDWDETVMVTKTRVVPAGNGKTRVQTYTVPQRKYHPEEYIYETKTGDKNSCNKKTFNAIITCLNSKPVFKDMHRNYRSKDGDAYVYNWNNMRGNAYTITKEHSYQNKVKASSYSLFKYHNITDKEKQNYNLFEYPDIINHDQTPILGYNNINKEDEQILRFINGFYGPSKQFRMYILCFDSPSIEVSEIQKAYWQGGNKNELVICLGIKNDSVIWCNPFSWCDKPTLEVKIKDYFLNNPKINFKDFAVFMMNNIDKYWERKEFNDFNYISVHLTTLQYILILTIILIYNIIISYWVITNEYRNEKINRFNKRRR